MYVCVGKNVMNGSQEFYVPEVMLYNFDTELEGLRGLMIYPEPRINERDVYDITARLIIACERENDIEYRLAEWGYDVMNYWFAIHGNGNKTFDYIQAKLDDTGRKVFQTLKTKGMYIGGVFPYRLETLRYSCDAVFRRNALGRIISMRSVPYQFKI